MSPKIPSVEELSKDAQSVFTVVSDSSDLACVLIISSFLDQCLVSLLSNYFIQSKVADTLLDPTKGIIGTISSRNSLCYCLGLISKTLYENLRIVIEIRNLFAHSHLKMDFSNGEISKRCFKLTWPTIAEAVRYSPGKGSAPVTEIFSKFEHPRVKYSLIGVMIGQRLLVDSIGVEHRKRKTSGW